ncbi:MAG TPA: DUF4139 domain-containing protein, partial [Rhodanobacteraceae bacterium]|nr:DUF4139 domain-containing protein [Rhodanobacteraceae bacterium]
MHRSSLPLAAAIALVSASSGIAAAENPALTIYRADGDALFENGGMPTEGYAIVHEQRALKLAGGHQALVIDGLPATLDAEAVSLDLGAGARVLAQRVLSTGDGGMLAAHRGEIVLIGLRSGSTGGTLLGVDNGALIVRADDGQISYIREYDTLMFTKGSGLPGSTLQLTVDGKPGDVAAALTYPTSGLGWRAAYSALLLDNAGCRMRLDALASIANRSGRDYPGSKLKLVAGSPNMARPVTRPYMAKATMAVASAPQALPEQSSLGDYRSYAVDGTLDLPDASVTQVPLYASSDLDCERRWIFESSGAWFPPKPMINKDDMPVSAMPSPVASELRFTTAQNLPAGHLRVLTRDRDSRVEFLGEARINDTQKGQAVPVALGTAFDLSARRERTAFSVDKAAHEMNEGYRITLMNTGETARTITVREHPNRWRAWTLMSSNPKPAKQTPDLLEFEVAVPANG